MGAHTDEALLPAADGAALRCAWYCRYCATSKLHAASTDARDLFPPGRIMHLRPYEAALPPGMDPAGRAADALPEVWDAAWVSPQGEREREDAGRGQQALWFDFLSM